MMQRQELALISIINSNIILKSILNKLNYMDLIINDKDAYSEYGVKMGENFLDSLGGAAPLKDYITNSNRLKNGVSYCKTIPKLNERDITLTFNIEGSSHSDFITKKKAFYAVLYAGDVNIKVPDNSDEVFHLKYTGRDVSYAQNTLKTFCKLAVKFKEPDPSNRT